MSTSREYPNEYVRDRMEEFDEMSADEQWRLIYRNQLTILHRQRATKNSIDIIFKCIDTKRKRLDSMQRLLNMIAKALDVEDKGEHDNTPKPVSPKRLPRKLK